MPKKKSSRRNEDLLEAILEISKDKGYAKSRDVAAALKITPATVTDGFKRLSDAGMVNYERYGGVTLTDTGITIAMQTRRSHDIIRKLLEIGGVGEEIADRDACIMEHGLSEQSRDSLTRLLAYIEACSQTETGSALYQKIVLNKITI